MQRRFLFAATAAAALLAACGGGNDPERGELRDAPTTVATLSTADINAAAQASGLAPLAGAARCDVRVMAINYETVGVGGSDDRTNASGAVLVPAGACAGERFPLVAYARGTELTKTRALANPQDPETFLLAAMYAAQGYAVVATDYLGYARSDYSYHPYLHADSEASAVIDSVRAARRAMLGANVRLSGKVMVTGYSQGGHASAATQREMEARHRGEFNVVAGAHLAAPVNLSGSLKLPEAILGYQFFVPFLVTAWDKIYGNVYTDVNTVFKAPYASYIETLLPSPTLTASELITTGRLPAGTPNQARDALFQPAFLQGIRTQDDHPLNVAARDNDVLGWTPRARTLYCVGGADPTVPKAVHQDVAMADFARRGVDTVTAVDVDAAIQQAFAPGGVAPTDPTSAAYATYYGNYHGGYAPGFCAAQARAFFNTVR